MNKVKYIDKNCNVCDRQLNTWDERISKTLSYKYPLCEDCICKEYDMDANALRERMEHYFGIRPCLGI